MTKIQHKRSSVLVSGAAKAPTSAQLDYGELAINYSSTDPQLFIKDSGGSVISILNSYAPLAGATFTGDVNFDGEAIIKGDSTNSGALTLNSETNSKYVKIKAPANSALTSYTLTLPVDDGSSGNVLTTDGSGGLSWALSSMSSADAAKLAGIETGATADQTAAEILALLNQGLGDNDKLLLGTGNDLEIYHDGGGSYISNNTGVLRLQAKSGENSISLNPDGSVELYCDHVKKFETSGYGIWLGDGTRITLGNTAATPDLHFYHDGTDTNLQNITGDFILKSNANGDKALVAKNGAATELYYDNAKKLETKSDGVEITGHIDIPNVNSYIKGGGHSVIQVDAGKTYFYGGSSGVELRKANNSAAIITVDDSGNASFCGGEVTINATGNANGKMNIDSTPDGGNSAWGLYIKNNDSRAGRPSIKLQNVGNANALEVLNSGGTATTASITTAGAATFTGTIDSSGTSGGRGAYLGNIKVGYGAYYNSIFMGDGTTTLYLQNQGSGGVNFNYNDSGTVTVGSASHTVWHAGNDGSGSGLDADTLDGVQGSNYLRGDADDTSSHALTVKTLGFTGVGGNSNNGAHSYAIYQESGAWSNPFPDLRIAYHTGISIGAHPSYGGVRFMNDGASNNTSEIMSVNNAFSAIGTSNVYVNNHFQAGTSIRAPIYYDSNDTAYYANPSDQSVQQRLHLKNYAGSTSVGQTSNLQIQNNGGTGDSNVACLAFHCSGYYGMHMHLRHDGNFGIGGWSASTFRWYVDMTNGNMTAAGNITAYSDIRLKEEINPLSGCLDKLLGLNGVSFRWKDLPDIVGEPGKKDMGIIAQEIEKVFPEVVHKSAHESPDGDKYKTVAYDKLVPVLIEAVKELSVRLTELEAK